LKLPFGLQVNRLPILSAKPLGLPVPAKRQLNAVYPRNGGWYNVLNSPIQESYAGAWQQNVLYPESQPSLLTFSAVFACVSGISSDIAKLRMKLMEKRGPIWVEVESHPFLKVLRQPNDYQTYIQFRQQWIQSLLLSGNAYIALERNNRGGAGMGDISAMYVLDPCKVKPLVSDSGLVFYELAPDPLSQVQDAITIPAEDIMHDRINTLWHPLIGVSPLTACAASAYLGAKIQGDSAQFFANRAMPGGMLSAPGRIGDDTATRLSETFHANFGGTNMGKVLIAGDGLKFEPFRMTAEQSQTAEQLKMTVSDVGRAFRYPEWKMGGPVPAYATGYQAYQLSYFADTLQFYIEGSESCYDQAFGFGPNMGVELDTDNLMRMDTASLYETINKAKEWMHVDEQRLKAGYGPTEGGDDIYKQHQDHSLKALAARDKSDDPFGTKSKAAPANPQPADPNAGREIDLDFAEAADEFEEELTAA
jgi:HK97 family phage portal protein